MKKTHKFTNKFCIILLFLLASCAPGEFLSGAGGADATPPPEADIEMEPPIDSGNGNEVFQFHYPTLTITVPEANDQPSTTGLSTPALEIGSYQFSYPKTLLEGEEGIIDLIIAPTTFNLEYTETFPGYTNNVEVTTPKDIEIYAIMSAELILSKSFLLSCQSASVQVISSKTTTIWHWCIVPQKPGVYIITATISVPADADGTKVNFKLIQEDFKVKVVSPTPTPTFTPTITPTPTKSPTLTSTPSLVQELTGTAGGLNILVGMIVAISTITLGYLTFFYQNKKSLREKEEREKEDKRRIEKGKEIINQGPFKSKKK